MSQRASENRSAVLAAAALWLAALVGLWGCAPEPAPEPEAAEPAAAPVDPDDPTILLRPFTAEQIRDGWVKGLVLRISSKSPEGETLERWTVVSADTEGAEIEYATLDAEGGAAGEPRVARSGWVELRDHATFPTRQSTRQEVTRTTALGELAGWLYTVTDEEAGTVSELFFAEAFPGAPVEMRLTQDGEVIMEMTQLEHLRPQ